MVLGAGAAGAVGSLFAGLAGPIVGMLGPFGKPVATTVGALAIESLAKAVGMSEYSRELGDGGLVLAGGQVLSGLGLPVGIAATFPSLPGQAAPAGALMAGNTPTGTGAAIQSAPAGGRYAPSPGYGSLSPQLGVGL